MNFSFCFFQKEKGKGFRSSPNLSFIYLSASHMESPKHSTNSYSKFSNILNIYLSFLNSEKKRIIWDGFQLKVPFIFAHNVSSSRARNNCFVQLFPCLTILKSALSNPKKGSGYVHVTSTTVDLDITDQRLYRRLNSLHEEEKNPSLSL